jgi:hypothetical protein
MADEEVEEVAAVEEEAPAEEEEVTMSVLDALKEVSEMSLMVKKSSAKQVSSTYGCSRRYSFILE